MRWVGHPASVTDRCQNARNVRPAAPVPAVARGPEHRVAALTLAALLGLGGLMAAVNLLVGGVVRDGTHTWLYGAAMVLCMGAAVPLIARRRAGRWPTFGLVLLCEVGYLVAVNSIEDPVHNATPLLLLFPAFVAAWFLGRWEVGITMTLTTLACVLALRSSYESVAGLALQVGVHAGTLNIAALAVFVLRRRVQRLLAATQALSSTDPLTGLANRRSLVEQAGRVWRQARRDGTRVAAMVLDLDHFKRLNDAHGHAAGDAVLRGVAGALTATVRPADVLARTGGEELVVLGLVGDTAEATRLAERLRAAVSRTRTDDGHAVTASIGIALTRPVEGEDATDGLWRLVDRADAAMYHAKQQGRDRVAAMLPRPRPTRGDAAPLPRPPRASDVA